MIFIHTAFARVNLSDNYRLTKDKGCFHCVLYEIALFSYHEPKILN